jgi:DNA-binding NarL/FixJ family response regulator
VRAFDDVARGIEHDLYNALTPVEAYTELLLGHPERLANIAQATAYLNTIMSAARDAKSTIDRMQEFCYSTGSTDFEQHESVSQMLARALSKDGEEIPEEDFNPDDPGTEALSPREWDVLRLLSDGLRNREIAEMLAVSENTVKTHIKAILGKLSLKNRTRPAAYALLDQHVFEEAPGS